MPPGPGRPKGLKNKFTRDVREMVLQAIDARGGVKFFERLEDRDLVRLAARLIPQEVKGDLGGAVTVIIHKDGNGKGPEAGKE